MKLQSTDGYLHWVLPAMLMLAAAGVLISGRDLAQTFIELAEGGGIRGPIIVWGQRLVSILLLAAAGERIANHFIQHRHLPIRIHALGEGRLVVLAGEQVDHLEIDLKAAFGGEQHQRTARRG
ncbi:MAG: hypothetical protein V4787_17445, partial [Pseudomonadota bacterium]